MGAAGAEGTAGADGAVGATAAGNVNTAFGVFCWLEVTDFDFAVFFIFLCFVLHITFQSFVVCVVSVAPNSN